MRLLVILFVPVLTPLLCRAPKLCDEWAGLVFVIFLLPLLSLRLCCSHWLCHYYCSASTFTLSFIVWSWAIKFYCDRSRFTFYSSVLVSFPFHSFAYIVRSILCMNMWSWSCTFIGCPITLWSRALLVLLHLKYCRRAQSSTTLIVDFMRVHIAAHAHRSLLTATHNLNTFASLFWCRAKYIYYLFSVYFIWLGWCTRSRHQSTSTWANERMAWLRFMHLRIFHFCRRFWTLLTRFVSQFAQQPATTLLSSAAARSRYKCQTKQQQNPSISYSRAHSHLVILHKSTENKQFNYAHKPRKSRANKHTKIKENLT